MKKTNLLTKKKKKHLGEKVSPPKQMIVFGVHKFAEYISFCGLATESTLNKLKM